MSDKLTQKTNPIKALEQSIAAAKGIKDIVKIDVVKNRHVANYEAVTGRKDGLQNYEREAFALIELANSKPEIMECDAFSIMAGFLRASSYGLPISSGKLSIYPQGVKQKDGSYKQMLVVKPDAHGRKELLMRMPTIRKVDEGVVVYKDDAFTINPKLKLVTKHEQAFPVPKASKDTIKAAYCTVHFTDGHQEDIIMSIDEIEIARSKSKQPNGQMWAQSYAEACKKTTYNRAYKVHYIAPDTVTLYKQFEAPESVIESEHEVVTESDPTVIASAESVSEEFNPSVNEQTGEVYEPEVTSGKKKGKKEEPEAFA